MIVIGELVIKLILCRSFFEFLVFIKLIEDFFRIDGYGFKCNIL